MLAITVNELSMSFGARDLFKKVSFALEENDKLGIIGTNGCGKSTLFKIILGEADATSGNVYIAKNKTIGILTQDCAFEISNLVGRTALEQMYAAFPELLRMEEKLALLEEKMALCTNNAEHIQLSEEYHDLYTKFSNLGGLDYKSRCASILLKMGFEERALSLDVDLLSGGQRTRLALSKQLCREPDLLLLDEPTNHLDIETVQVLENYIKNYKKCVLIFWFFRRYKMRYKMKDFVVVIGCDKEIPFNYTINDLDTLKTVKKAGFKKVFLSFKYGGWSEHQEFMFNECKKLGLDVSFIHMPYKDERAIEKISIAKNDLEQMPRRANELRQKVAEAKNLLDRLS